MHTTIYSISESPRNGRRIWVGTDDGRVQMTARWRHDVDRHVGERAGGACRELDLVGRGEPPRRASRLRGGGPPHLRRHGPVRLSDRRRRPHLAAALPGPSRASAGTSHVIREDLEQPDTALCGHGVRAVDLDRRRRAVGAVQAGELPRGRGARPRGHVPRPRSRARDPRPRDLDRRRHHAAPAPVRRTCSARRPHSSRRARRSSASRRTADGRAATRRSRDKTRRPAP